MNATAEDDRGVVAHEEVRTPIANAVIVADDVDEISLTALGRATWKERRLLAVIVLLVVGSIAAWTLLRPRTYSSVASFVPQMADNRGSGLGGLAAQFGLVMPRNQVEGSPQFYAALLRTREVLGSVATSDVAFERDGRVVETTLVDALYLNAGSEPERQERTILWLRRATDVSIGRETGMVTLTVTTRWPQLSQVLAARMLELVNEFNLEQRRSQATAERQFTEARLVELRAELEAAEVQLQRFLASNRQFVNSAELRFEHDRLQRELIMRQELVTSLAQAYEQARIDEVRNLAVITVVERPALPVRADSRDVGRRVLLALLLSALIGLVALAAKAIGRSVQQAAGAV